MRYEIRPLGKWLDPVTNPRRSSATFRSGWADTLGLLEYETEQLGAQLVVVQVDVRDADIRRDGMLYANARVDFPGVRVSFDSVHGPLTYSTDAYDRFYGHNLPGWQANVRAIALALEALRAVDRYGVSGSGQQYTGWTAIDSRPAVMTREQAAEFIAHWAVLDQFPAHVILSSDVAVRNAYRQAAKRAHPDVTRDDGDTMARLNAARDLLLAAS